MPRNKNKKIFTASVSLIFALCIAYFAVLPPTSAWFYVNLAEDNKTFIFGTFGFDLPIEYFDPQTLDLPAATKLEDPAEAIAFDEAMHIETISATNNGTLPARVYLTVSGSRGTPESLHYFLYNDSDYNAAALAATASRSGETTSLMDVIRTRKNKHTGLDANIVTDYDPTSTYAALNAFNIGDGIAGVSDEGNYVVVPPNTTQNIYIAFWVDYNVAGSTLENTTNVNTHYVYNNIEIKLSAGQDSDGWFIRP